MFWKSWINLDPSLKCIFAVHVYFIWNCMNIYEQTFFLKESVWLLFFPSGIDYNSHGVPKVEFCTKQSLCLHSVSRERHLSCSVCRLLSTTQVQWILWDVCSATEISVFFEAEEGNGIFFESMLLRSGMKLSCAIVSGDCLITYGETITYKSQVAVYKEKNSICK